MTMLRIGNPKKLSLPLSSNQNYMRLSFVLLSLFLFISNASKAGETNMLDIKDSIIAASTKTPFF